MNSNSVSDAKFYELPRIVSETKLLQRFASESDAFLLESEGTLRGAKYYLSHAQSVDLAGFGRASTKRGAAIKAVAEFYERRLMLEAFKNELKHIPKYLQTSNGFAVQFTQELANKAAMCEAIERHLLQLSYLKEGWAGFELVQREAYGDETLNFLVSKNEISGWRAGMIAAQSARFPGFSFGYFCARSEEIRSSERWAHGIYEATDKIEPFLKLAERSRTSNLMPIDLGILDWMMTPAPSLTFSTDKSVRVLTEPNVEIQSFDLAKRWDLDFPLYGAFCSSFDLLPLVVSERFSVEDRNALNDLLNRFGIRLDTNFRNPIL